MLSPDELEIKELEKKYAVLNSRYEEVGEQIEGELNCDNRDRLESRRKSIKKKRIDVWNELEKLKKKSPDRRSQHLAFEKSLPKIDFRDAMDEIDRLMQSFEEGRGDALLLLEKSLAMSGDLCLKRVRNEFKDMTSNFVHHKFDLYCSNSLNEYSWLGQLGGYFGFLDNERPEELAKLIIDKICQSVKTGNIVFLEIGKWDILPCQQQALSCFIRCFWMPLVERLNDRVNYQRVKFVAAIVGNKKLPPECFGPECLRELELGAFRWLKLPLRHWKLDEIQQWLERYQEIEYPRSMNLATSFYDESYEGIPNLVRELLEKELLLTLP